MAALWPTMSENSYKQKTLDSIILIYRKLEGGTQ